MRHKRIFMLAALPVIFCGGYITEIHAAPLALTTCKTITTSGSYIVTKNLLAAGNCLVLQVDNVTIDLDGYTIKGKGTGTGITDNGAARKNITIRNGIIASFADGIGLAGSSQVTIERVNATQNTGTGIIAGGAAIIKNNVVVGNGSDGISVAGASLITGNIANGNGSRGIYVPGEGNTISSNVARVNNGGGIELEDTYNNVFDNTATDNQLFNFRCNECSSGNNINNNVFPEGF